MANRNRKLLGVEKVTFVDGEEVEIKLHRVTSFERTNLRRLHRRTEVNKKGDVTKADFNDDEFIVSVLKKSIGSQMSEEDIKELDCVVTEEGEQDALKYLYDKYFGGVSQEKKSKSTDMSEQNQDKSLKE